MIKKDFIIIMLIGIIFFQRYIIVEIIKIAPPFIG